MMARMSAAVSQPLTTPPGTAGLPSSAGSSETPNGPDHGKRWTRICAREGVFYRKLELGQENDSLSPSPA